MTPLLSDARLARQATDGDQRAFSAIYRRYQQDLYRFCLSILGRPADAQDALQNTMVKALRSLPGEEREIRLKPWLYRVAHNESIDLLRKRREGPELDDAQASGAMEIAETVAVRERLGRLLADLGELPDRQRSALIMRELGGLGYEQISEAFETSISVARQTVYEARLNLRELEAGREMSCDHVTRQISDADGRITRRRDIQAHLRACAECRAFRDSIDTRRHDLAAISPLPAALAASMLHGLAGGHAATGASGALAGGQAVGGAGSVAAAGVGAGAGKIAASSVALKAVATLAAVATVGVTVADRGGLIDAGLPGGHDNSPSANEERAGTKAVAPASSSSPRDSSHAGAGLEGGEGASTPGAVRPDTSGGNGHAKPSPSKAASDEHRSSAGSRAAAPAASRHGQETAAAHKANPGAGPDQGHGQAAKGNDQASSRSAHGRGGSSSKSAHAGGGPPGSRHGSRGHRAPQKRAPKGTGTGGGQASKPPPPLSPEAKAPSAQPEPPTGGDAAAKSGGGGGQTLEPSS